MITYSVWLLNDILGEIPSQNQKALKFSMNFSYIEHTKLIKSFTARNVSIWQ